MNRVTICAIVVLAAMPAVPGVGRAAQTGASADVEFGATVVPAREAEITPIVSGWLNRIDFKPGQYVRKGDVLFEFDQDVQKLKVKQAEAQLARAQATLRDREAKLQRTRKLQSRNVMTEADLLEATAARDIAAANVEDSKASLGLQETALERLTLKAPFSGMMSAPLVKENGWQYTGKDNITMAVITQLDPIRVIGMVPYSTYADWRKLLKPDEAAKKRIVLSLVLPNGGKYPHEGKLVSGGYKFDKKTQEISVWGEFPNPDLFLRPGLNVTLRSHLAD